MDSLGKSKAAVKSKLYRNRVKNDPMRHRLQQEKRKQLNCKRRKIADLSEDDKKKYREKKKNYMASYRRKLKECTYQGVGVVNNMEKSLLRKLTALRWQIKSTKEAVRSEMKKKLSLLGIEGDMESSLLGRMLIALIQEKK